MEIPSIIYYSLMNFVLFVIALYVFLRRPARDFFANRAALLQKKMEDAAKAEAEAQERLAEIQARMVTMESEIQMLRERIAEEGEFERVAIVKRAEEVAAKMHQDTTRLISQELKNARGQLRATTVDMAILLAERMLQEQLTPDDHGRLVLKYVERLGALH